MLAFHIGWYLIAAAAAVTCFGMYFSLAFIRLQSTNQIFNNSDWIHLKHQDLLYVCDDFAQNQNSRSLYSIIGQKTTHAPKNKIKTHTHTMNLFMLRKNTDNIHKIINVKCKMSTEISKSKPTQTSHFVKQYLVHTNRPSFFFLHWHANALFLLFYFISFSFHLNGNFQRKATHFHCTIFASCWSLSLSLFLFHCEPHF